MSWKKRHVLYHRILDDRFAYVFVSFLRTILVFYGGLRASRILFEKLLESVTSAKLRFFDTTPIGRIMNRFSKDMETVDQETSWVLVSVFSDILSVTTIVVLITVITPGLFDCWGCDYSCLRCYWNSIFEIQCRVEEIGKCFPKSYFSTF